MTKRTQAQQALWDALPATTTGMTHKHYENLTQLPDDICEALVPIAYSLYGLSFESIQASAKMKKLSSMTMEEIISAFQSSKVEG